MKKDLAKHYALKSCDACRFWRELRLEKII